jgi:hypothetical protein
MALKILCIVSNGSLSLAWQYALVLSPGTARPRAAHHACTVATAARHEALRVSTCERNAQKTTRVEKHLSLLLEAPESKLAGKKRPASLLKPPRSPAQAVSLETPRLGVLPHK